MKYRNRATVSQIFASLSTEHEYNMSESVRSWTSKMIRDLRRGFSNIVYRETIALLVYLDVNQSGCQAREGEYINAKRRNRVYLGVFKSNRNGDSPFPELYYFEVISHLKCIFIV